MATEPVVAVRGEALIEADPEIARIGLTLTAHDRSRKKVLRLVEERSQGVLARVRARGQAIEAVETAAVRIHVQYKDGRPKERIDGYRAQITHNVTMSDFAVLGDLLVGLAEEDATDVAGPWWSLRRDSDLYLQAQVAAV